MGLRGRWRGRGRGREFERGEASGGTRGGRGGRGGIVIMGTQEGGVGVGVVLGGVVVEGRGAVP